MSTCRGFVVGLLFTVVDLLQTFDLLCICHTAYCTTNSEQIEVTVVCIMFATPLSGWAATRWGAGLVMWLVTAWHHRAILLNLSFQYHCPTLSVTSMTFILPSLAHRPSQPVRWIGKKWQTHHRTDNPRECAVPLSRLVGDITSSNDWIKKILPRAVTP